MIKLIYGLDTYNGGYLVYRLHDDGKKLRLNFPKLQKTVLLKNCDVVGSLKG